MPYEIQVALSLIGVVLLLLFTYFGAKWITKKNTFYSGKAIKILEKVSVTPDKALAIIAVGDNYFLVGITSAHIEKIAELDKNEIDEILQANAVGKMTFSEALSKSIADTFKKNGGGKND